MTSMAQQLQTNKIEAAIICLQEDYGELNDDDIVVGMSIFENEVKATMFIAMKKGKVRDIWLKKEIEAYRNKNT
jgi:hypothetical protein